MKALSCLLIGSVAVCGTLWMLPHTVDGLPPCHIHAYTGLLCPGCGTTRALHALVHGDITLSLRQHPLLIPGFLWLCALCCTKERGRFMQLLWWGCGILLLFTLLRNLPIELLQPIEKKCEPKVHMGMHNESVFGHMPYAVTGNEKCTM